MKILHIKHFVIIIALGIGISCTKEQFSTKKNQQQSSTSTPNVYSSGSVCAEKTVIRPPVDFLFLWDNSSSQNYASDEMKQALSNIINSVSTRFDAHFLLSPLIRSSSSPVNTNTFLVATSNVGLSSSALSMLVDKTMASSKLYQIINTTTGSSEERGFERAIELIQNNRSNGIFRNNSYTMIAVMSNEDVRIYDQGFYSPYATQQHINQKKAQLLSLRDSLKSLQFRFMSIVPHSEGCQPYFKKGNAYISMSSNIYSAPYSSYGTAPSDQGGKTYPDSYDICSTNYLYMFDGINQTIQNVVLKHKYDYWPIENGGNPFDQNSIVVTKHSGDTPTLLVNGGQNGFTYVGHQNSRNTRYEPTSGEPYTGYMIRLHGTGRVTYPDCLTVETTAPSEYWGYVVLASKPYTNSIVLTINGTVISQSTTNGWEYIDHQTNKNVKILDPSQPDQPGTPEEIKTGYFLKLHGSAIYGNGANVSVHYDPML